VSPCQDLSSPLRGRASNEEHPAFEKERFITRRFAEWVKAKSVNTNLASVAKQAGMNQVFLRRLFHSLMAERTTPSTRSLYLLGIALVNLAGNPRPMLTDVERRYALDVLPSAGEIQPFLASLRASGPSYVVCVVRDIEFDVLDISATVGNLLPHLSQSVISSRSLVRVALKLMVNVCEPWFKSTAAAEHRSPISVRKLFVRQKDDLKKSASNRVRTWAYKEESKALAQAYDLKERFLRIWPDGDRLRKWQHWKSDAEKLPERRFQDVIDFVVSRMNDMIPCFEDGAISEYERWLDDVQKHEVRGTHSFAAARLALLAKFGQPEESSQPPFSEEEETAIASISNSGNPFDESR
jgi:hypothetical protein